MKQLILTELDFIKEAKRLKIDYKKYVGLKVSQIEDLKQNNNFIKQKTVKSPSSFQRGEIINEKVVNMINLEDTHYYFHEGDYVVILIEPYSNWEPKSPDEEIQIFSILPSK